jgi:hypothetical protein
VHQPVRTKQQQGDNTNNSRFQLGNFTPTFVSAFVFAQRIL